MTPLGATHPVRQSQEEAGGGVPRAEQSGPLRAYCTSKSWWCVTIIVNIVEDFTFNVQIMEQLTMSRASRLRLCAVFSLVFWSLVLMLKHYYTCYDVQYFSMHAFYCLMEFF